uniref:Uncharacterized protein n=1 Tax=Triticum urartu TaxID=4572 RepID=A0A8R7R019_TRIUA
MREKLSGGTKPRRSSRLSMNITNLSMLVNSCASTSMHRKDIQTSRHLVDSTHVCTASRAVMRDRIWWRISSGRLLILSLVISENPVGPMRLLDVLAIGKKKFPVSSAFT